MKSILIHCLPFAALIAMAPEAGTGTGSAADAKAETGDKAKEKAAAAAKKAAAATEARPAKQDDDKPAGDHPDLIVNCPLKSGRRRAGRSWPAGKTPVPANTMTEAALEELMGDTYLAVYPAKAVKEAPKGD